MAIEAPPIHPPKLIDTTAKTFKTQEPNRKPPAEVLAGEDFSLDPVVDSTIDSTMLPPAAKVSTEDKRGNVTEVKTETPTTEKKDEKPIEAPVKQIEQKVEVKKEEAAKEVKKEEPKVEAKKPKVDLNKPLMPSAKEEGANTKPAARDYSGYSEQEAKVLKQMSNEAFEFTTGLLKRSKEQTQAATDIYLQNPNAYQLSPEYAEVNQKIHFNTLEQQIYERQLLDIKEGKDWSPLRGFNPQTGEPVFDTPQKATPQAELQVQRNYNAIAGVTQQNLAARQNLTQQFVAKVQNDSNRINEFRKRQFGWIADPKVMENKVSTPSGEKTIATIRNEFLSDIPAYRRNDIIAQSAADMFVSIVILSNMVNESKTEAQVERTKKEEVLMGEPLAENGSAGKETDSKKGAWDMSDAPEGLK